MTQPRIRRELRVWLMQTTLLTAIHQPDLSVTFSILVVASTDQFFVSARCILVTQNPNQQAAERLPRHVHDRCDQYEKKMRKCTFSEDCIHAV